MAVCGVYYAENTEDTISNIARRVGSIFNKEMFIELVYVLVTLILVNRERFMCRR